MCRPLSPELLLRIFGISVIPLLEDGHRFYRAAAAYAAHGSPLGELVFTTSDDRVPGGGRPIPASPGQLITFTQPMIGNYGVEPGVGESDGPHARAAVSPWGPKRRSRAAATGFYRLARRGGGRRSGDRHARDHAPAAGRGRVRGSGPRRDGDRRRGPGGGAQRPPEMAGQALAAGVSLPGRPGAPARGAPSGRTRRSSTTA